MTVLALATVGDATKNRNDPISFMPPKVAKASGSHVAVTDAITNKFCQYTQAFMKQTLFIARVSYLLYLSVSIAQF